MLFERTFSGAPWEDKVGYCRAIRAGRHIYVTGTAPVTEDGAVFEPGNAAAQTDRCIEIIKKALNDLGADLENVVRTRMYVTDIARWEDFAGAHRRHFGENPPATTLVEVSALIDPQMLIEIEVDAVTD